jgi:hypothetical protein
MIALLGSADDVNHAEAEYIAYLIELLPTLIDSVKSSRGALYLRSVLEDIERKRDYDRNRQMDDV